MSKEIKDILMQHKGKSNAIASKRISEAMGFPMEDTQSVSRKEIWNTADEFGLPLVSCNNGYFIAQTDDEIEAFNNNYEKRISGMRKTQKMANKNYKEWKNENYNKNDELVVLNGGETPNFPKYTSQLINWANQNAQGTRPKVVGQLSDLFPEYESTCDDVSISSWREWYLEKYPDAIENATNKIFTQVENLKEAIKLVDKELVRKWVDDLVITKTYNGLYVQEAILSKIAVKLGKPYRLATSEEESQGIDGYVGETPYSVKPDTYKTMGRLSEVINVKMVYYTKKKTGLTVEVEE